MSTEVLINLAIAIAVPLSFAAWPRFRYALRRFAEFPEVNASTSPTAMIVYQSYTLLTFFFCLGVALAAGWMTTRVPRWGFPFSIFLLLELLVVVVLFGYGAICAVRSLESTYRLFFTLPMIEGQLESRGYANPSKAHVKAKSD